jgi:hypothetical protein
VKTLFTKVAAGGFTKLQQALLGTESVEQWRCR